MSAVAKAQTNPVSTMTRKERLLAALRGEPVDRAPVWLREGFPFSGEPADADHFTNGWQADPAYRAFFEYAKPRADYFVGWGIGGMNRFLLAPPSAFRHEPLESDEHCRRSKTIIKTPRGELETIREQRRGEATGWNVKHLVQTEDELRMLAEVPFEIDPEQIAASKQNYQRAKEQAGNELPLRTFLSSPIVCISGAMKFELFLELSLTQSTWFHELCEMVTQRQLAILRQVFDEPIDSVVSFGGSEQCTPPMMAPQAFDEYVVPYDGQLVNFLHDHDCLATMHCHGKVKHALQCMVDMGVDGTDPVEPPPAGDVSYAEAREIAGDKLTLMGNLEWDELEIASPEHIRGRVREILGHGARRLIMGASAGPITAVSPKLLANYRVWLEAVEEFS